MVSHFFLLRIFFSRAKLRNVKIPEQGERILSQRPQMFIKFDSCGAESLISKQ
jgi:hypothetical protein